MCRGPLPPRRVDGSHGDNYGEFSKVTHKYNSRARLAAAVLAFSAVVSAFLGGTSLACAHGTHNNEGGDGGNANANCALHYLFADPSSVVTRTPSSFDHAETGVMSC